jgi:hypothetical protein
VFLVKTKILDLQFMIYLFFKRMDLGECSRTHDLALRADYQLASKDKDYFYDVDVS